MNSSYLQNIYWCHNRSVCICVTMFCANKTLKLLLSWHTPFFVVDLKSAGQWQIDKNLTDIQLHEPNTWHATNIISKVKVFVKNETWLNRYLYENWIHQLVNCVCIYKINDLKQARFIPVEKTHYNQTDSIHYVRVTNAW